jgi:AraC-like DNA-binding protein
MRYAMPDAPPLNVVTMLTPAERGRVDAAGDGSYRALHRDGIEQVIDDLKCRRADAVLLSVARCDAGLQRRLGTLVREFPGVPTVALLTPQQPDAPEVVLRLGSSGVRRLVDVRQPTGWADLRRHLLGCQTNDIQRQALATLAVDLAGSTDECWRLFEMLFLISPRVGTVRVLARRLGVVASTLMSRFYRAQLPPPKRYLALARLVRAARLFENPGFSVANVANHLDYSSPQSFGRHLRALMGVTAGEFRSRYDGEGMLREFRERLVLPYRETLLVLRPMGGAPAEGWMN